MTSKEYRKGASESHVKEAFEAIVPPDWGAIGPIELGETLSDWQYPPRQSSDLGWAYVSIGGESYSEAVTVTVTLEDGEARIRTVEFGRP
jgi:hypothetical protein